MSPVLMDLARVAPEAYLGVVFVIIASIVLHELGHAWTATWQGDPTPRLAGHLTWDPRVHMGWMSIILVATIGIGFGRTPTTPRFFRDGRKGNALVSVAGPAVNLLLGVVLAISAATLVSAEDSQTVRILFFVLHLASSLNFALFILNMIPIPPLDGFHVMESLVDARELFAKLRKVQTVAWIVLFVVVWNVGFLDLTDPITDAIIDVCVKALG